MLLAGVLAFFFFTQRIPIFAQEAPALNYYWVPLLVRQLSNPLNTAGNLRCSDETGHVLVIAPGMLPVTYYPLKWGVNCYTLLLRVLQAEVSLQWLCTFSEISFHICFAQTFQIAKAGGEAPMTGGDYNEKGLWCISFSL